MADKPFESLVLIIIVEVLDLRFHEVTGNAWYYPKKTIIRNRCHSLYLRMVILYEFKMRKERRKIRPTRERLRLNHQSVKPTVLFDIGIDFLSQVLEVRGCQRPHGRNDQ